MPTLWPLPTHDGIGLFWCKGDEIMANYSPHNRVFSGYGCDGPSLRSTYSCAIPSLYPYFATLVRSSYKLNVARLAYSCPIARGARTKDICETPPKSGPGLPVRCTSSPTKFDGNSGVNGTMLSKYSICLSVSLMLSAWMLSCKCLTLRPPTIGNTLMVCRHVSLDRE